MPRRLIKEIRMLHLLEIVAAWGRKGKGGRREGGKTGEGESGQTGEGGRGQTGKGQLNNLVSRSHTLFLRHTSGLLLYML